MDETPTAYDEWGRDPDAPLSTRLGGAAIAGCLKAVYATSRMIAPQADFYEKLTKAGGEKYIWALWHRQVGLASFFYPNDYDRTCMASRSRDGELLTQVLTRLGAHCVRGSSSSLTGADKGGAAVFRRMVRVAKKGRHHLVVTPDGPKGPPGKAKIGVAALSGVTGCKICPVAFAASLFFTIPTWDKTIFPLPFGKISVCYGDPLEVPRTRDAGVLEETRAEIEKRLIRVNEEAKSYLETSAGR